MAESRSRRNFTREEAGALLRYEPDTGQLLWRIRTHGGRRRIMPGDKAGTLKDGYVQIKLFGLVYRAQHLAWLLMTGDWPDPAFDVEHRDRNRANNAWPNLRLATRSQNNMNASRRRDNRSGHRGVSRTLAGKWHARITIDRRVILLGDFLDKNEAVSARRAAEVRFYGDFAASDGVKL